MSKKDEAKHRVRYTLESMLEAVRLIKAGQEASVTARLLGIPKQTLSNWVRLVERRAGQPSKPGVGRLSNEALLAHIRAVRAEVKGEYSWPRVWKELLARGIRLGKDRV